MTHIFSLDFPRAFGDLTASADFRTEPEDFQVDESLGFEPSGQGEHVYLHIRKRGENTVWVAEKIAAIASVAVMDIGYCGRKDRHAITSQWFSVYLPRVDQEPDWASLNSDSVTLISFARHTHKLRRGDHQKNYFVIRLRNLKTSSTAAFEQKIAQVFAAGVPNYFGEQRFGHGGNNLHEAHSLLVEGRRIRDKQKRGFYLSAARSYLFNLVVAARVAASNWQMLMDGEPSDLPSAPLWGRGRPLASGELAAFEASVLADWADWCNGMEHAGLLQERRHLLLKPENAAWRWIDGDIELSFSLGSGEFATTILAELSILHTTTKSDMSLV
jgi:tRNA pseudouridine13 synthase